jgi:predicted nucleotidyltransferase
MDVKEHAASILGGKTDIMTRNSLHPRLRKRIEEAAVLIFDDRTNRRATSR